MLRKADAFKEKNAILKKTHDVLLQALFRQDPDSAVRTLVEDLHYTPEEAQQYRERFTP